MSRAEPVRGHRPAALLAAAVGLGTSFVSGACGPGSLIVGATALVLALGRGRGWRLARVLARPGAFAAVGAVYLPWFFVDLLLVSRGHPVEALTRLVVFLIAAECLAGDPARTYRPLLLGLLLLVTGAAETTEIWFLAPLTAYLAAAIRAQVEATTVRDAPPGADAAPTLAARPLFSICATSLALGAALFFVIPRFGAGWAAQPGERSREAALETGLAESVELGMVGRVKRRTTVALRATVSGAEIDPEGIYWRARAYTRWTGSGWFHERDAAARPLLLPAGRRVLLEDEAAGPSPATLVSDIRIERRVLDVLPLPGRPLWIRAPHESHLVLASDGTLSGMRGLPDPRYEVAVEIDAGGGATGMPPADVERTPLPPAVEEWARSILPDSPDPVALARALEHDLRGRPYSLDTRGVDPARPIASFLAGAPAHCEYFATAMALGLRERGVPARVVGGYLGADRLPFSRELVVRESRAHLWVEAFLQGRGWVRFDPTPAAGRAAEPLPLQVLRGGWARLVLAWDGWVVGLDLGDQIAIVDGIGALLAAAAGAPFRLLAAVAILAGVYGLARRVRRRRRAARPEAVPELFRTLAGLATRLGMRVRSWETARELAGRVAAVTGEDATLERLRRTYERHRFHGQAPEASEVDELREAARRIAARYAPTAPPPERRR